MVGKEKLEQLRTKITTSFKEHRLEELGLQNDAALKMKIVIDVVKKDLPRQFCGPTLIVLLEEFV